jgi:hypothetical protein
VIAGRKNGLVSLLRMQKIIEQARYHWQGTTMHVMLTERRLGMDGLSDLAGVSMNESSLKSTSGMAS